MSNGERTVPNQQDLKQIWLQIATDIKIRKFENLDNIPEFHQLPNQLQIELKNEVIPSNGDYKIFHNEQGLINSHVILFGKGQEKYLALYEDKVPSTTLRSLFGALGITAVCVFVWNYLFKIFTENQTEQLPLAINNNPNDINTSFDWNNFVVLVPSIIPSALAYPLFRRWFSTQDSAYNKLVEGCMLKKLESISNSQ